MPGLVMDVVDFSDGDLLVIVAAASDFKSQDPLTASDPTAGISSPPSGVVPGTLAFGCSASESASAPDSEQLVSSLSPTRNT